MQRESIPILVREIRREDADAWENLRRDLWPEGAEEHAAEIESFFAGTLEEPVAVLVAEDPVGRIVAIAELSLRTDVAGLEGMRVGYVEGLFVIPEARHCGVAVRVLQACRDWVHQQQCTAFASDRSGRIVIDRNF